MPIIINNPVTIITNDIGDIFEVESSDFKWSKNEVHHFWRIKTLTGKVLKQGLATMDDTKEEKTFTIWYNNGYKLHSDLVKKVAELAGYSGLFTEEVLK